MYTQQTTTNTSNSSTGLLNTNSLDHLKEQMERMLLQNEQLLASFKRMSISTDQNASFSIYRTEAA